MHIEARKWTNFLYNVVVINYADIYGRYEIYADTQKATKTRNMILFHSQVLLINTQTHWRTYMFTHGHTYKHSHTHIYTKIHTCVKRNQNNEKKRRNNTVALYRKKEQMSKSRFSETEIHQQPCLSIFFEGRNDR